MRDITSITTTTTTTTITATTTTTTTVAITTTTIHRLSSAMILQPSLRPTSFVTFPDPFNRNASCLPPRQSLKQRGPSIPSSLNTRVKSQHRVSFREVHEQDLMTFIDIDRPRVTVPRPPMASSEVDQKLLGRLAKAVEPDNPLLGSVLFKLLGLSLALSQQTIHARKVLKLAKSSDDPLYIELYLHIIWLSREGSRMLEQYVLPMVGNYVELKVLAYKLRASFYHIFVLFHNQPPVSIAASRVRDMPRSGGGKKVKDYDPLTYSALEGGAVGPPPGFGVPERELAAAFIMPTRNFLPETHRYFQDAVQLANTLLWGSHSLRLSVKTEYCAFLYECMHDYEGSRQLAKATISEVYEATEPMDDDMFLDASELVTVLGKMTKRGVGSRATLRSGSQSSKSQSSHLTSQPISQSTTQPTSIVSSVPSAQLPVGSCVPPGMENMI